MPVSRMGTSSTHVSPAEIRKSMMTARDRLPKACGKMSEKRETAMMEYKQSMIALTTSKVSEDSPRGPVGVVKQSFDGGDELCNSKR